MKLLEKFNVGDNIKNINNYNNAKIINIIPPPHGDMVEQYEIEYDDKSISKEILTGCKMIHNL